ncbi:MAG: hypothetical protein ACK4WJ_03300, partial [Endomicrobiia bacterium]
MKEAKYYRIPNEKEKKLQCNLCPHNCLLKENQLGKCLARKNINGKLYSLTYEIVSSIAMDPIEKKPLYHFYPGKTILSIGSYGCNFKCGFCQNWEISQSSLEENFIQKIFNFLFKLLLNQYLIHKIIHLLTIMEVYMILLIYIVNKIFYQ